MKNRPLILVTNDDGMFAPGIKNLIQVAKDLGDIVVVAPDSPQSAKGHAVTMSLPLRLNKVEAFGPEIEAYECSGTPVDCVKLAKHVLLKERSIDLCLSGINHGSNASVNIIYSGTMSAAMEASIEGIPSIGFSLLDYSFEADFSASVHYARIITKFVLEHGISNCNLLNVNIPRLPLGDIKGIKVCRQAEGRWIEEFTEGLDPRSQKYYWLTGNFVVDDNGEDTDIHALENGYVSVVPSWHDLTRYPAIESNKGLESFSE
ncbi:MAG: 5'/3'-nucleotidase SurE [Saprospirales bacterium]|nr:MAG: 5'/3'-nucleotidase SurE [Saprospirales bacterium]